MIKPKRLDVRAAGLGAGVWVLTFVYVWLRVKPELEFVAAAPVFRLNCAFFQPFIGRPGGLVDYAARFLAQCNYYNWLGAAVSAGLVGLVFWIGAALLSRFTSSRAHLAALGLVFLFLAARQRLDALAFNLGIGVALALGAALGYGALPARWPAARMGVSWVMAGLLFYVAGLWPCALFALLCMGYEARVRRRWVTGLGCGAAVLGAPLLWRVGFPEVELGELLNPWDRGLPLVLAGALYVYFPVAAGVVALLQRLDASATATLQPKRSTGPLRDHGPGAGRLKEWIHRPGCKRAASLGFCATGVALVWIGLDTSRQGQRTVAYYAAHNQHERLLAVARQLSSLDPDSEIQLHRALFHSGRLLQELFTFTNQRLWTVFPGLREAPETLRVQSQTLLELGQVNIAEHLAHEALEVEGERPDLLRLLAVVQVLKSRPQAARVFLQALSQVPFHRVWARTWLERLEADPRWAELPELGLIRSRMVTSDLPHSQMATASFLRQLLQSNPRNQMAFEYLLAHYLLDRQLDALSRELPRLGGFSYPTLPRHIEEAVLLYQHLQAGTSVDLRGRQIRPETVQRFQQFTQALGRNIQQTAEGRQWLAQQFGDTYWHYYFFVEQAAPATSPLRATESP